MKRHALITGASSGIGESLCRALAQDGYSITACARRTDLLQSLVQELQSKGCQAQYFALDVSQRESLQKIVAEAEKNLGPIDLLIANAGIGYNAPAHQLRLDALEQMIDVNMKGAILTISSVLPSMVARKTGQIVGISSLAGYRSVPTTAVYSATKAGFSAYLEGLRPEMQLHGIHVMDVCPGFIETPMTAKNKFRMPFLMTPDEAAHRIVKALKAKKKKFGFPLPMHWAMRFLQMLPNFIFDALGRKIASQFLSARSRK